MKYKKQALSLILGLLIISLVLTACTPTPSAEPETTVASVPATTLPAEITISPTASTEATVPPTVSTETPPTTPTHVENSGFYLHNANILTRFGTAQYTVAEIRAMKDYSASELQAAISTVADMIQYIVETDYGDNSMFIGGVSLIYNNYLWAINKSPEGALLSQSESCGAISNLVRYVLEDDYDEEGYIHWRDVFTDTGICGGHVFNYFKQGDTYLIFDFSTMIHSPYLSENSFTYVKNLERFVPRILNKVHEHPSQANRVFFAIFAERDVHRDHLPIASISHQTGKFVFILDSSFQDDIELLHFDEDWLKNEGSKWLDYHPVFQDMGLTTDMIPADLVDSASVTYGTASYTP